VFPRIQKKYEDPVSAYAYEPIFAIRYRNSPLAIIRFTEQGNFVAFIDRVVFAPKLPWILLQPNVFLKEGLGFEINNVHAIEFDFSPENLREFIIDHLKKHKRVTKWLVLKYNLFMGRARDNRIKEKRGFRAFRELDNITYQVMENEVRPETRKLIEETLSGSIDDNIIDFASFVFLHTFAHVMKNIFVARYGCKSEDINYYIEHPKLQTIGAPSERVRLIILETAMGGYGYLKNFIEEIKQAHNTELFEYLISTAIKSFESCCESKSMDSLKRLPTELRKFEERNKEFVDLILRAYHMVFPDSGLYPHVNSIRRALVRIFPVIPNESRSLLDDMLAKGPHCWDGCQLCVMLERECNFLPFDQPFLVSRGLIKACMSTMKESLRNASLFFPLKKGLIKEFQEFCNLARDKIYIASPWISPEIVDQLYFLFKNRGVIIRILTKIDPNNEIQVETIKKLREITSKHAPAFEARIMKELHGKGMLIDGIMALHGSFNFTLSGLNSNVENVTIDYDIGSSRSFEEQFEKHWKQAIPIISIHKQDENK